jgi:hypothetical protein
LELLGLGLARPQLYEIFLLVRFSLQVQTFDDYAFPS